MPGHLGTSRAVSNLTLSEDQPRAMVRFSRQAHRIKPLAIYGPGVTPLVIELKPVCPSSRLDRAPFFRVGLIRRD